MKKTLLVMGAAASLLAIAPTFAAEHVTGSGFLPDYSKLVAVPGTDGFWRYLDRSRAADIRTYSKIYIHPVEIVVSSQGAYKAVRPDVLNRIAENFKKAFADALSSGYELVDAPAPDALGVRFAVTGIQPVSPPLGVTDFIPLKMLFNAGRAATGNSAKVAEMSAEIEVLDGSGHQVAASVSTRKSDKNLPQTDQITWEDLSRVANVWSKQFRQGLDTARGVSPAPSR